MLFLTSTDTLEVRTPSDGVVNSIVSYVDLTASSATEGRAWDSFTTSGASTACPAPASGARRAIKSASFLNADSSPIDVRVQVSDGSGQFLIRDYTTLQPGDALHYESGGGWYVTTALAFASPGLAVLMPLHFATANLTSTKTITTATTFAVYLGKTPRSFTSCSLRLRVTTAAATITWAEVAIARGEVNVGGNPTLRVVGWSDAAGVVNSLGQKTMVINVASGQHVAANDDLWALIGNQATTALQVRAQSIADDIQVGLQASLATRPSLNVGTAQAYTIESATALAPWVALVA
jgi:hypothetical protein